jgi:S1-C subfamily serine protease
VLLVDAGKTRPLALAEQPTPLGAKVYAVGYPFVDVFTDKAPAVSVGHVAGTSRNIDYEGQQVADLLLTDAFVADGCSGGPLLAEDGQVIGVLRFNLSRRGTWLGLSFAQPIAAYRALYGGDK